MRDRSKTLTVVNTQKRSQSTSSGGTTMVYGTGGGSAGVVSMQGSYLPAKRGEDGTYIVDISLVRFTGSVVSEKEISAYQSAEEGVEENGAVTIYDALDSEATDIALSANQGRILKLLIEEKIENYKNNLTALEDVAITAPADGHVLIYNSETKKWVNGEVKKVTWENIEGKPADLTEENIEKWNNKLDKAVWDSAFYFDDSGNLRAIVNVIGEKEVSAYGAGATSGTGSITIVDALTSEAADCALSANMGRVLKQMIDAKEAISDWSDIKNKPTTLSGFGITDAVTLTEFKLHRDDTDKHITAEERDSWNNKLDKAVWDSAFYFDEAGNIRVKLNLIGEKEVSAYGAGASSSGAITIVDALTSTSTDAALSANQGRILKQLIDSKSSISSWEDITDKPDWIGSTKPAYTWTEILNKPDTFTPSEHTHDYVSEVMVGSVSYTVSSNTVYLPSYPTLSSLGAAASSDLSSHTGNSTIHITSTERSNWNTAYNNYHSHSNKSVLDGISSTNISNWNTAYSNYHSHSNKTVLDGITSTKVSNWNTAYNNYHSHSNKSVLDGITSTKVSNWDSVYTNWNKAFYFDTSGNLRVKLNLVGEKEVSAYDSGSSGNGITIIDALTSTSADAALSANQGRVLKQLIDEVAASGSGSGSTVSYTQTLNSGTAIGRITINGTTTTIYAPSGSGSTSVVDSLTSTSTTSALSANQGRVLKGLVDEKGAVDSVTYSNSISGGVAIGKLTVDGTTTTLYAPQQYATSPKANYTSGINLGYINVNGTNTYFYAPISVSQKLTSGTEIGSVTIAGTTTKLYAPTSSGGGSTVSFSQTLTSGTEIGKITIDGTTTTIYAPSSSGGTTTGDYLPLGGGTLTGNLRLKNTSNYGMYLYFGDGSYCYLNEDTDDHLTIYASRGINLKTGSSYSVQVNGADIPTGSGGDYLPLSGGALTGGFRFNYWTGSGTIPSSANVVVATGNVTLPSASTAGAGHVIFIHHKGGDIKVSGSIYDSAGNAGAKTSVTMDGAHMAVSDGSYWRWFWCK